MKELFSAKIPVTYTENIELEGVRLSNTMVIGYFFTTNLALKAIHEQKKKVAELLRR